MKTLSHFIDSHESKYQQLDWHQHKREPQRRERKRETEKREEERDTEKREKEGGTEKRVKERDRYEG